MAAANRIKKKFAELKARGEAALIPFIVAGDPDLDTTRRLVLELDARGADMIELGVPFSDPMADGPANQRSLARGLGAGASLAAILSMVSELRAHTQIPLILFGYYNPIFHYGCQRLCADAARAGIDGMLCVDLPPEEADELKRPARANGIDIIFLLAPTTPIERSRKIARSASGFLYYVAVTGVTGARAELDTNLASHMRELRSVTDLPLGVGFGISTPAQAAEVAKLADAVVVGSAISLLIEKHAVTGDVLEAVGGLVGAMKTAMNAARRADPIANAGDANG
ncbi:MAG: tryptophan synthase subunit alpha [Candidatus Binatus sp.]|uniref:tryptophan synthase subunit alpha n=1 Tax=Candidatus Binatus sp. TaxID=2811406 RepID=UPI002725A1FE|nr:tryptophan synthase subunit alpha [Candidatus Binatus sp.]MDO8433343.1 tryptophan synthase subunit alpha [Candidatus Binatus sp.]